MAKRNDALTGDLFSGIPQPMPHEPASMDFRRRTTQLVSEALKQSGESRFLVAARMSELADVETSKALLDSYTAESREECNLPLWKAPIIEAATGSRVLAEWHVGVLGGRILWGHEVIDADIGRRERLIRELKDEVATLKTYQRRGRK